MTLIERPGASALSSSDRRNRVAPVLEGTGWTGGASYRVWRREVSFSVVVRISEAADGFARCEPNGPVTGR